MAANPRKSWKILYTQGVLWSWKNSWKTRGIIGEFCATSGKNYSRQNCVTIFGPTARPLFDQCCSFLWLDTSL